MPRYLYFIFLCLFLGASAVQAGEKQAPAETAGISPEDLKVVAVMDVLELMDLAEELDMIKDINYLIEEDQYGTQND